VVSFVNSYLYIYQHYIIKKHLNKINFYKSYKQIIPPPPWARNYSSPPLEECPQDEVVREYKYLKIKQNIVPDFQLNGYTRIPPPPVLWTYSPQGGEFLLYPDTINSAPMGKWTDLPSANTDEGG